MKFFFFTYKSIKFPPEPPLMDATLQLKELWNRPNRENTLKEFLQKKDLNAQIYFDGPH